MLIDDIEAVARAIYETHWRRPAPRWDEASDDVRDWVRKQALSAINALRGRLAIRSEKSNTGDSGARPVPVATAADAAQTKRLNR